MLGGDSLSELLKSMQLHVLEHHEFPQDEIESPDRITIWEGAIKQSARPGVFITSRDKLDYKLEPHLPQ